MPRRAFTGRTRVRTRRVRTRTPCTRVHVYGTRVLEYVYCSVLEYSRPHHGMLDTRTHTHAHAHARGVSRHISKDEAICFFLTVPSAISHGSNGSDDDTQGRPDSPALRADGVARGSSNTLQQGQGRLLHRRRPMTRQRNSHWPPPALGCRACLTVSSLPLRRPGGRGVDSSSTQAVASSVTYRSA